MAISSRLVFDVAHDVYVSVRADMEGIPLIDPNKVPSDHQWRPNKGPRGEEFAADFAMACKEALAGPQLASRMVLCSLFYLQVQPYDHVRNFIGITEHVWSDWTDQIRDLVGKKLLAKGMWPPKAYFGERTRQRRKHELSEHRPNL
jgi:hypothetical protein